MQVCERAGELVWRFIDAWVANELDIAIEYFAPDAVYVLHISNELLPIGGETAGRDNIKSAFRQVRQDFKYLMYRAYDMTEVRDTVRFHVEFMYRHRASGEVLQGRFRVVLKLRDGLIARAEEYHDRAMVETFMRLHAGA